MLQRAYAVLHVKGVEDERRLITGIASTPQPDRMGDIVEPLGITFTNPLPLLLYHNTQKPVGSVTFDPPTAAGLTFTATLPKVHEAGVVHDRIEEAWQSLKAGLLAGVSIGFRAIEEAWNKETQGFHFLKTEVLELSLVAIPANAGATVQMIKALDRATAPAPRPQRTPAMTIAEQITAFENTRAAKAARLNAIMASSAEANATLDETQTREYDGLEAEVSSVDAHLVRLRALEKSNAAAAVPVSKTPEIKSAAESRSGTPVISVKAN